LSGAAVWEQGVQQKVSWRWVKFNLVGGVGIGVQLVALWVFADAFHWNYLVATALAVETAVLHNFLWHQRFTWADRRLDRGRGSAVQLLQFNLTNGVVSILGNVILMRALVGGFHLRILLANAVSIAGCSVANFVLSETYVFRARRA
jgi:putative flippase GtrA